MQSVAVAEFKANLSKILDDIETNKEKYILEYGRNHKKIAVVMPFEEAISSLKKRTFGQLEGVYEVPEDFDEEVAEINAMFYGK